MVGYKDTSDVAKQAADVAKKKNESINNIDYLSSKQYLTYRVSVNH